MTTYLGSELQLFEKATNWKAYYGQILKKYLTGDVLEVGAGIGATTQSLCDGTQRRWVCLEPDAALCAIIQGRIEANELPPCCEVRAGSLATLSRTAQFDVIIYIDVLEHIEDDHRETLTATEYLKPGGYLIILSPAHQWLFTPFDKHIGHFRRYNKKSLLAALPTNLRRISLRYLDSVGMLASTGNRFLLRSALPTASQLNLWDKVMIPLSRWLDPLLAYRLGKTILGIWQKP